MTVSNDLKVFKAIIQPIKDLGLLIKIKIVTGTLRGSPLRGWIGVEKSAEEGNCL